MRISSLIIENFKIFKGENHFNFKSNLIFLVGENNTGKTTILEAINFVKSGLPKDKKISDIKNVSANLSPDEHVKCTIIFTGDIKKTVDVFSEKKYEKYIYEEDGEEKIKIQRSTEGKSIDQGENKVDLNVKKITVWNHKTKQYENPSGIDNVISSLFQTQFIWADTDPDEILDLGSTKICGRLLEQSIGDFFGGEQWRKFIDTHKETFHGEGDSVSKRTAALESEIYNILEAQYGKVNFKFKFPMPEVSAFYKGADIVIDDGTETHIDEKGTGLQRAVALAIVQVYADKSRVDKKDPETKKPLFFFIDEPEICLHPKAQSQLLDALMTISQDQQVFLTTHSPFFLKKVDCSYHDLFIFNRNDQKLDIKPSSALKLFKWSPSWGEINYRAYGLCTVDFHNELYGYIQNIQKQFSEEQIEKYFESKTMPKPKKWTREKKGIAQQPCDVTLMTYIRNKIHHPENENNTNFTPDELEESVKIMISLLENP